MHSRASSRSGFTLIELMIVLLLIGIFSGLIMTEMRGSLEDAVLRSTARKIISSANLASSKAVTLNRPHWLLIDPDSSLLKIQVEQQGSGQDAGVEESLDSRINITVRDARPEAANEAEDSQDEPEKDQANQGRITFFPDGTASGREISLRDRMGVELLLRINPITGRIRILESETAL